MSKSSITNDWQTTKLKTIIKLGNGKSRPKLIENEPKGEFNIPIYGGNGILGYSNQSLVNHDTIVIGRVGEYCGSIHVSIGKSWVSDNAIYVKEFLTKDHEIKFLSYLLEYLKLNRLKRKTGQPLITQSIVENLKITSPPYKEQNKIATILSTVDEGIRTLQQLIYKKQTFKRGLTQRLFSQGVGHTEFKESKLRIIPKEWSVVQLQTVLKKGDGIQRGPWGSTVKKSMFVESGYKIYEQRNVSQDDFTIGNYYISENKFNELRKYAIQSEDILITGSGTIGKIAIVPAEFEKGIMNQALVRLRINEKTAYVKYLKLLLEYYFEFGILSKMAQGAVQSNLVSVKILKSSLILLPSFKDQEKILTIMNLIEKEINMTQYLYKVYKQLKEGLMQQLLTGKIRVKMN